MVSAISFENQNETDPSLPKSCHINARSSIAKYTTHLSAHAHSGNVHGHGARASRLNSPQEIQSGSKRERVGSEKSSMAINWEIKFSQHSCV